MKTSELFSSLANIIFKENPELAKTISKAAKEALGEENDLEVVGSHSMLENSALSLCDIEERYESYGEFVDDDEEEEGSRVHSLILL